MSECLVSADWLGPLVAVHLVVIGFAMTAYMRGWLSSARQEVLDPVYTLGRREMRSGGPGGEEEQKYPYRHFKAMRILSDDEAIARSEAFYRLLDTRRSVRMFSSRPVPLEVICNVVRAAGTSPSGAHKQPWTFVVVQDAEIKRKIRVAAEKEEKVNYDGGRMNKQWQADLAPLGTDWHKEFLETCPFLIIAFKQTYGTRPDGTKDTHYYFERSIGIATGMLISAIHAAGLCTLTHTPTPMAFLTEILGRPENEKPYLLLPVGYPAAGCFVPDLERKALENIMQLI